MSAISGSASQATATCYRHDDREAGRRCTRCGKPACGECLVSANVGSHCLECTKAARPDLGTRARHWQAGQHAIVSRVLIGINLAVFFGLGALYGLGGMLSGRITDAHVRYGLNDVLITDGSAFGIGWDAEQWYRLVTAGFLHFGIIHVGMNMYFLYLLGNEMERPLGRGRFLLLYFAGLLGGSAGALLLGGGGITAGASGAVFGLLGAYAVSIWQHGINVFQTQIGTLLLINLFLTFAISNISIGGHLGGLVAGGICGFVMMAPGWKGIPTWATWLTPVGVSLVAIGLSVAVVG
ncbi:MAG: rhomboid family intramembrane serine protease [Actinomycetota bacterium]